MVGRVLAFVRVAVCIVMVLGLVDGAPARAGGEAAFRGAPSRLSPMRSRKNRAMRRQGCADRRDVCWVCEQGCGSFMRDHAAEDRPGSVILFFARLHTACKRNTAHNHSAQERKTTRAMARKANATQKDTVPAELRKLAVQAVKHKATIDDANFKKRELRETLVRLQEALEERRAEERRIAEEARRREEEEAARLAAEEEARRRAEEERLAAEAEADESEESEEEDEEPEPEQTPTEAVEEESSEEEEDADELMPEPTLRGRVAPGMVPFMARAAARPMPPAPRRKALPPPPPIVAVTPESESESEEEEEPVKVECDEASAEEIESEDEEVPTRRPLCVFTPSTRRPCPRRNPRTKSKRRTRSSR